MTTDAKKLDRDHELTADELARVAGGKPSAAPKQPDAPKEAVTFSYGAIEWQYTPQR